MTTSTVPTDPKPLSTPAATLLVAEREITTQVRSKSFVISLIITVIIFAGGIILMGVLGGDGEDDAAGAEVAVLDVDQDEDELGDTGLETVPAGSMDEAETLLREGEVEAIITTDPQSPVGLQVIGLDTPPADIAQLLSASPTLEVLEDDAADGALRFFVPFAFGLVFIMLAMGSGVMIMQNTVQEKQSRIVEILLASISARALLAGKILGNWAIALGQAVVLAAASVVALLVSGQQGLLDFLTVPMLWFVLFFVPGFVLIAAVFAAGASLVSRQEDMGAVMMPAMTMVMIPYFVVIFFADNDLIMTIASYVPFATPVAMPVRMFFGETLWFEPLIALAVLVAAVVVVMLLAARIYSRSLLQTGQRVKLGQAMRSGD